MFSDSFVGSTHGCPYYMRNLHVVIIYDVGEMVGWQSIRLQDNGILECGSARRGH